MRYKVNKELVLFVARPSLDQPLGTRAYGFRLLWLYKLTEQSFTFQMKPPT